MNECVYEYVRPKTSFGFFHKTLQKNFLANPIYAYENVGFLQENEMKMFHLGTLVDTSKSLWIKLLPLPQLFLDWAIRSSEAEVRWVGGNGGEG